MLLGIWYKTPGATKISIPLRAEEENNSLSSMIIFP